MIQTKRDVIRGKQSVPQMNIMMRNSDNQDGYYSYLPSPIKGGASPSMQTTYPAQGVDVEGGHMMVNPTFRRSPSSVPPLQQSPVKQSSGNAMFMNAVRSVQEQYLHKQSAISKNNIEQVEISVNDHEPNDQETSADVSDEV